MGRAQLLDKLGSPLPVSRLLRSLCSGSFENAAAVITVMTEKLTTGIMREGPVWGLPKEAVYSVTHQQPRTLPSPSDEGRAASTKKPRKGRYWGREKEQGESSKGGGKGKGSDGEPPKRDKPPSKPSAAPKVTKGSRPPGKGKKEEQSL